MSGMEQAVAEAIKIRSDEQYEKSSALLVEVKKVGKLIEQEKRKQLDPANATVKAIREFWKKFEEKYEDAETSLKTAVLEYKKKLDARNQQKAETIANKVEEGKMSFEKGAEKMAEIENKPTTHEGVKAKKIKKVRFAELNALKDEQIVALARGGYLEWNTVKARADALAGFDRGVSLPGAEVYEEEILAV